MVLKRRCSSSRYCSVVQAVTILKSPGWCKGNVICRPVISLKGGTPVDSCGVALMAMSTKFHIPVLLVSRNAFSQHADHSLICLRHPFTYHNWPCATCLVSHKWLLCCGVPHMVRCGHTSTTPPFGTVAPQALAQ